MDASKETQLAAVQMVVDLVWCAGKCYAAGGQTGSQVAANEALLRECETALNAITKLRQIPINKALAVKAEENRTAEVEAAVSSVDPPAGERQLAGAGTQLPALVAAGLPAGGRSGGGVISPVRLCKAAP